MTLRVTTDSLISEVQEQFQVYFPDFKLEFFFSSSEKFSHSLHHSFPFVRIGELMHYTRRITMDIKDTMTIGELEWKFRRKFGLPALIYKKVGKYWQKKASFDRCTLCEKTGTATSLYFIHGYAKRIAPDFSIA
jgi:hypothetical protein